MFYCIYFKTFLRMKKFKGRFMCGSRASKQLTFRLCQVHSVRSTKCHVSITIVTLDSKRHMLDHWVTQRNSNMVFWYILVVRDSICFVNIGMLQLLRRQSTY